MDRFIIYAAAFLRSIAVGMTGVFLALYLGTLGFGVGEVGFLVSMGLAGGALGMLWVTYFSDRVGRRRSLIFFELLAVIGTGGAALASSFSAITVAIFVGMVNGMGRDRGPSSVIDQALLPATGPEGARTRVLAWYNTVVEIGRAIGNLLGALPYVLRRGGIQDVDSYRYSLGLSALLVLAGILFYGFLSSKVESSKERRSTVSPESRRRVFGLSGLFFLDSLGGGFIPSTVIAYWFFRRFGFGEEIVAPLFFAARIANAVSYPIAAGLAKRIGLLNTMVFTHVPGSLLLIGVALVSTPTVAILLFLVRELLIQMDVPTRQSYVLAVVRPDERIFASGWTNMARAAGWAAGPYPAGLAMEALALSTPLHFGAGIKILYDILLFISFRRVRPPEERS